jgi:hypothetical protein
MQRTLLTLTEQARGIDERHVHHEPLAGADYYHVEIPSAKRRTARTSAVYIVNARTPAEFVKLLKRLQARTDLEWVSRRSVMSQRRRRTVRSEVHTTLLDRRISE